MAYRLIEYKYYIIILYALFALSLSAMINQDALLLLNFAILGLLTTYFLLKNEPALLFTTVIVSIFHEGLANYVNSTYIVFFLYLLMIYSLLIKGERLKLNHPLMLVSLICIGLSLAPLFVNGTSLPLLLTSLLKRFGFLIVFVFALNMKNLNQVYRSKMNALLITLLILNFFFAFLQYMEGAVHQDMITGLMGDGMTGIYIYLFMFYLAITAGLHYQRKISTLTFALFAAVPLAYSAIAEVKIGFVTIAILLFIYLVFIERGYKAYLLLIGGAFAFIWFYNFFVSLYPTHEFLSREFLERYLVEDAYGGGSTLNRFGFKPVVDTIIFSNSQNEMLFGKGLGSGNPSEVYVLMGDIYRHYDYLKYSWFTLPYLYIENGIIGTASYVMIYLLSFLIAIREYIQRKTPLTIVLVLMGLTNIMFLPYNAGLLNYSVTTIYWIYFAMVLQEKYQHSCKLD